VILAALVAASATLAAVRDARYADPNAAVAPFLDIQSASAVRQLTMSFQAVAADVYWIRAVQYFGSAHAAGAAGGYPLLYPLLDVTTTLDPRFNLAYRFGAMFLAEPIPGGAGRPDLAVKLLDKGIAQQPQRWEYFQDIGFVYYIQRHDYRKAAEWFQKGSRVQGAPWWLGSLAAVTLARGGDRAGSRFLWERTLESAGNDWLRKQAERRLSQLDAMDQIDELQHIVSEYRGRTGQLPSSFDELQRAGLLRAGPLTDPSGAPYQFDPVTGRVSIAPDSALQPLPADTPGPTA
jgi:hypothetical protein